MNKITNNLFSEGKIKIIKNLNGNKEYSLSLSRKINRTYCSVVKNVDLLVDQGIIQKETSGRKYIIKLTDKGYKIKVLLLELERMGFV